MASCLISSGCLAEATHRVVRHRDDPTWVLDQDITQQVSRSSWYTGTLEFCAEHAAVVAQRRNEKALPPERGPVVRPKTRRKKEKPYG